MCRNDSTPVKKKTKKITDSSLTLGMIWLCGGSLFDLPQQAPANGCSTASKRARNQVAIGSDILDGAVLLEVFVQAIPVPVCFSRLLFLHFAINCFQFHRFPPSKCYFLTVVKKNSRCNDIYQHLQRGANETLRDDELRRNHVRHPDLKVLV